jgi:hypothetical protein
MPLALDVGSNRGLAEALRDTPEGDDEAASANAASSQEAASNGADSPEIFWNPHLESVLKSVAANSPIGPASSQGPDFDAQVRGTDPKAIDQTLGKLSQDCYDIPATGSAPKSIDGFTRMSDAELEQAGIDPASLEDPATGFRAAIYENAQGDKVVAFAGTRDGKDWFADGTQALGLPTAQYREAVELATQAKAAFGDSVVMTGHSLGGGLASIASVATDSAAVTFNAAGVNDKTLRQLVPGADVGQLKQEASDGLIRRYAVKGEVLTGEQETGAGRGFLPDALGHKITLNDPKPLPWYEELPGVNLVTDTAHGVSLHSMDSVLSALSKDHPWTPGGGGSGVLDHIVDGTQSAGNAIVHGIDTVKNDAKSVLGAITGTTGDVLGHVPLVGGLLKGATNVLGSLGKGIIEAGGDLLDGGVGVLTHLAQGVEKTVGGVIKFGVDGVKKLGGLAIDGAKKLGGLIEDGAKKVGDTLESGAKKVGNLISDGAGAINKGMPWNW